MDVSGFSPWTPFSPFGGCPPNRDRLNQPDFVVPSTWNEADKTWNNGQVWNSGLSAADVADLRMVPDAWNTAHAWGHIVLLDEGETWDTHVPGWPHQIALSSHMPTPPLTPVSQDDINDIVPPEAGLPVIAEVVRDAFQGVTNSLSWLRSRMGNVARLQTVGYDVSHITVGKSVAVTHGFQPLFSADGTRVYAIGDSGSERSVFEYALSTAWDLATLNTTPAASYDASSQATVSAFSISWRTDGTKFYISGKDGLSTQKIWQYSAVTPWRLAGASYDGLSASINDATLPFGTSWTPDGTRFFVSDGLNIWQYDVSTPWVVTGASEEGAINVTGDTTFSNVDFHAFSGDGRRVHAIDAIETLRLVTYSLPTPWDLTDAEIEPRAPSFFTGTLRGFTFSSNGHYAITYSGGSLRTFVTNRVVQVLDS